MQEDIESSREDNDCKLSVSILTVMEDNKKNGRQASIMADGPSGRIISTLRSAIKFLEGKPLKSDTIANEDDSVVVQCGADSC